MLADLHIRRMDSGEYLATVGKETKQFETMLAAVQWAEATMEGQHD